MDEWRVRATLMKPDKGKYYTKIEIRSLVSPTHISFINIELDRSQYEIEKTVKRAGSMLADHQNSEYDDQHDTGYMGDEAVQAFLRLMSEIGEAGIKL